MFQTYTHTNIQDLTANQYSDAQQNEMRQSLHQMQQIPNLIYINLLQLF